MSSKPKMSERLRRQREYVESKLGDSVICDRCRCTLKNYSFTCVAELSEPCQGFWAIERHRTAFDMDLAAGRVPR